MYKKEMNILEYLKKNDILWEPVRIINEGGKKKTVPFATFTPKTNDYVKLTREDIIKRQQTEEPYDTIGIFTNDIQQYDIDVDGYDNKLFENTPYFKSVSKKLNHYFLKVSGTNKDSYEVRGGDLLCGKWSFCKKDAEVYNHELPIKNISIENIPKREQKTIMKIVSDLSKKEFSRNEWISLCFSIYNAAREDLIDNPHELLHEFSKGSAKYDDEAKKQIENIKYDPNGKKISTLIEFHKNQFPEKYEKKELEKKETVKKEKSEAVPSVIREDDAVPIKEKSKIIVNYYTWKKKWEENIYIITDSNQVCFDLYCVKNNKIGIDDIVSEDYSKIKKYFSCDPRLDYLRECYCEVEKTVKIGDDYIVKKEPTNCVILWNEDSQRRNYINYRFSPPGSSEYGLDNYYNLFRGFDIEKHVYTKDYTQELKNDVIDSYLYLINWLTNGEKGCTDYLIQFYADIIQNPGKKPGICIIIEGIQGSGKGTLDRVDEALFGGYFRQVSDVETIFGRFNGALSCKLLISIDEAEQSKLWSKNSPIKNLVTEPKITIEIKHKNSYVDDNFIRLKISSNNNAVVNLGDIEERRMVYIGSDKKFDPSGSKININEVIRNRDYIKILFDYLKGIDIIYTNVQEWQEARPITKKYREVKEKCVSGITKCLNDYILEFVENEERLKSENINYKEQDKAVVFLRILYNDYISNFAGSQGKGMNMATFSKGVLKHEGIEHKRIYNKEIDKKEQKIFVSIKEYIKYIKDKKMGTNELFYS